MTFLIKCETHDKKQHAKRRGLPVFLGCLFERAQSESCTAQLLPHIPAARAVGTEFFDDFVDEFGTCMIARRGRLKGVRGWDLRG